MTPTVTALAVLGFLRPVQPESPTETEQENIKKFLEFFPNLQEQVWSYIHDSSCQCKHTLVQALNSRPDLAQQYVDYLYRSMPDYVPKPKYVVIFEGIENRRDGSWYVGEVVTIPASPAEYRQLLARLQAERKVYNGLDVVVNSDQTWTLFFY